MVKALLAIAMLLSLAVALTLPVLVINGLSGVLGLWQGCYDGCVALARKGEGRE